ncbi:MAG: hypothetical protein JWO30_1355 [Fibrobacteres bacterium]|nr:hypothetical protein [Fibrobacterota bacterium]
MKKWILISAAMLSIQLGKARAEDNVLSPADVADGYSLLFDGTLASFKSNWVDYVKGNATNTNLDSKWILDATCHCITMGIGNAPDIRSVKTYKDFELRMNFRIDNNQGIFYRSLLTGDRAWQTGVEYAINNVTNLGKDNPGSAYDLYAPDPITYQLFTTNKWNSVRIVVKGDSVEHWMNEKKVVGYKYHSPAFWEAYNVSKWNAENRLTNKVVGDRNSGYIEEGYLGLQGDHGGKWIIKDLKITTAHPCFGPINTDGSSCGTTAIGNAAVGPKVAFISSLRQAAGTLTATFSDKTVQRASLIGLNGKVMSRASLSEGGRKAYFAELPKTGLYLLRLDLASGSVTQKLNIL